MAACNYMELNEEQIRDGIVALDQGLDQVISMALARSEGIMGRPAGRPQNVARRLGRCSPIQQALRLLKTSICIF